MLSHELDSYIRNKNYLLGINELSNLIRQSPQIVNWTFDVNSWSYVVLTSDGYIWKIKLEDDSKEK